jgi:hypothetical protein
LYIDIVNGEFSTEKGKKIRKNSDEKRLKKEERLKLKEEKQKLKEDKKS